MGEQFAVLLFFDDGKRRYARRFVSAQKPAGFSSTAFTARAHGSAGRCVLSSPIATTAFCVSGNALVEA